MIDMPVRFNYPILALFITSMSIYVSFSLCENQATYINLNKSVWGATYKLITYLMFYMVLLLRRLGRYIFVYHYYLP